MSEHSIGKTIAALRKSKGWTQVELAEKLSVSDKAVSKWESEAGLPEISQLPVMANLFDVTIDYIMTGKEPEKEIIAISKAELCAKTDDISLAEEVKDLPKDEKKKNVVDYILEYQSLNVFRKLCKIDSSFIRRFTIQDAITLATLSNSLFLLSGAKFTIDVGYTFTFENENEIKSLLPLEDREYFKNYQDQCVCLLPRSYFTLLVTDKRITSETLNILLSNQNDRECIWYHAFPYLIDEAYKNDNTELLQRLLDISQKNNAIAYDTIKTTYDRYDEKYNYTLNYFFVSYNYGNKGHGLVRIPESTIKESMAKGDFELLNKFNEINLNVENFIKLQFGRIHESITKSKCYIASDDEIRIAKLKLDKSISKNDLEVQSAIHYGIISIKELIQIKDFATVKKALYEYPIHPFEILYKMYQSKNLKGLFEFAVDKEETSLADALISDNAKDIENSLLKIWNNDNLYYQIRKLYFNDPDIYAEKHEVQYGQKPNREQANIQEVIDYLNAVRKRIIDELSDQVDKEKTINGLTKEYFYEELTKGSKETVIIKLCVRLEAILKYDYHYTGTFSEMLDRFCSQFNTYDDECNSYDPYTPRILNDLRRQRNSIVHSEKTLSPMSNEEIKQCIDYICSL